MTPPKRNRASSAPSQSPATITTTASASVDQFQQNFDTLKRKQSVLTAIDTKSKTTFIQDRMNRIHTLVQSSNRTLSEERELGNLFVEIENRVDKTIKSEDDIQNIISLLEVKQALSGSLHIPTIIVILNGLLTGVPENMKHEVIKKVKSSITSSITEREMDSIARAMGSKYYAIYEAHKHDINILAPKTDTFLKGVRDDYKKTIVAEKDEFFPNQYLDQNDVPLFDGIKGKLEATDNMSLDQIMRSAESVKLRGEINGKESWDAFFKDLRNEVPQADLAEFDKEVADFKVEFKDVYNSSIDTSKAGTSIDENLANIKSGALDTAFATGVNFKINIDSFLEIGQIDIGANDINIGPFTSKEEAVRSLYKIKLIFKELEVSGKSLLKRYYSMVLSGGASGLKATGGQVGDLAGDIGSLDIHHMPVNILHGAGLLVLTGVLTTIGLALPTGAMILAGAVPLESLVRRTQDYLSRTVGDKGWAQPLKKGSQALKKGSKFFGSQAIAGGKGLGKGPNNRGLLARMGNLGRLAGFGTAWAVTKPLDFIAGSSSSLLNTAEMKHLDPSNLLNKNTVLVDGIEGGGEGGSDGNDSNRNKVIEIRSRAKVLALLERIAEYEGNADNIERLEKIRNGSFYSNSESFYIDTNNIIKGTYDDTSRGGVVKRYVKSTGEVFLILIKKEQVINEYTRYMENMNQMLSTIYKKVEFDKSTGKITLPEKAEYTDFFKHMMADLDLGLISDLDEGKRQKLLKELIDEIKKYKVGFLTQDELKGEIQKIVEGKMPRFKTIQEIVEKRKSLTGNTTALENLEVFRKMVLENKWYGTAEQLDTILNDITHTRPVAATPTLRSLDEIQKEGDRLHKLSLKGKTEDFSRLTNPKTFEVDIKIAEMLIDAGEMRGNPNEIKRELGSFLSKARDSSLKLDWSVPEFHFIIGRILSGDTYSNRGDGKFGTSIDLDNILDNYQNFDAKIRDVNIDRLLTKVKTGGINTRINILLKIAENQDVLNEFKTNTKYSSILNDTEAQIKAKNTQTGLKLDAQKNRVDALMSGIDIDPKKGDGKTIDSDYRSIISEIQNLNREYEALDNHKTPLKNKVAFYNDALAKVSSIKAKIDKLEGNINRVKSAEARTQAEAEKKAEDARKAAETTEKATALKEAYADDRKANYNLVERAELQLDVDLEDLRGQALRGTIDKAGIMETLNARGLTEVKSKADIIANRVGNDFKADATAIDTSRIRDILNTTDGGIEHFDEFKDRKFYNYLRRAVKKGM